MAGSMTDIIERHRRPTEAATVLPLVELDEEPEEHPCYAKLRGPRQVSFMLRFMLETGDEEAFDYGLLGRVRFDRTVGIRLAFSNGVVTIRGKNLGPLFEAITSHRATWVKVADEPAAVARDPEETIVTAIDIDAEDG